MDIAQHRQSTRWIEFAAKGVQMRTQRIRWRHIVAPDAFGQFRSSQRPWVRLGQDAQDLQRGRAELQLATLAPRRAAATIQQQRANPELVEFADLVASRQSQATVRHSFHQPE